MKDVYVDKGMDVRRVWLRLLHNAWIVVIAAVTGALVGGGLYLLIMNLSYPEPIYQATGKFYLHYDVNTQEETYQYYNDYTWNDIMDADPIAGYTHSLLGESYTREEIEEAISARTPSDLRLLIVTVTMEDPVKAANLLQATAASMDHFATTMKELESVEVYDLSEAQEVIVGQDVWRASLLGTITLVILYLGFLLLHSLLEESIYVPRDIDRLYAIKVLGILPDHTRKGGANCQMQSIADYPQNRKDWDKLKASMDSASETCSWEKEFMLNLDYIFAKYPGGNICYLETERDTVFDMAAIYEDIRNSAGVILVVSQGRTRRTSIDRTIMQLRAQDCHIIGCMIADADLRFLQRYYLAERMRRKERRA